MKAGVLATTVIAFLIGFPIASFAGLAPDNDVDGIPDVMDKCSLDSRNAASPCDTDVDGYGNPCDPDFDQSGSVNANDFSMYFIPVFKGTGVPSSTGTDLDCSGTVNASDFSMYFIPKFKGTAPGGGSLPGPSGLGCAGVPGCL